MRYQEGSDINDPFGIRSDEYKRYGPPGVPKVIPSYREEDTDRTWIPPQPYIPGTGGQNAQLVEDYNEGWNSHARSKTKLDLDTYFVFTVSTGIKGCLLGIDKIDQDNKKRFPHSVVSDLSGIHVFENTTKIHTLSGIQSCDSILRVYNQDTSTGRKIIYVCTTGKETDVYTSLVDAALGEDLYIYGLLYTGLDRIETYEYKDGVVKFGAA